jgi:hypothetical protein
MLGREIVEGEQRLTILDQAFDCLVVFDAPGLTVTSCGRICFNLQKMALLNFEWVKPRGG